MIKSVYSLHLAARERLPWVARDGMRPEASHLVMVLMPESLVRSLGLEPRTSHTLLLCDQVILVQFNLNLNFNYLFTYFLQY
jgi:hypothetical protein